MDGQLLWNYLTGDLICPTIPILPKQPTYPPDADDAAKHALLDAFEAEMETYQSDLGVYETWLREEKSAKAILLASIEIDLARSLRGLATSHLMWEHLRCSYEIRNEAMYLAVVEEAQSLRQLDSTVDDFHRKMTDVWHRLDNLGAEFCGGGTCRCCDRHREQRDTLRLHEFLSRLRPEFETVRAQLLTRRPRPSLAEAMPELRAEETRLRTGGVSHPQLQPAVLVATPPPVSLPSPQSAVVAGVPSGVRCDYCKIYGHEEKDCRKKQRNRYDAVIGATLQALVVPLLRRALVLCLQPSRRFLLCSAASLLQLRLTGLQLRPLVPHLLLLRHQVHHHRGFLILVPLST